MQFDDSQGMSQSYDFSQNKLNPMSVIYIKAMLIYQI